MEIIYFLAFILFLFPATVPAQTKGYEYIMLVLQNPFNRNGTSPWTIHGLWAERLQGPSPNYKFVPVNNCPSAPPFNREINSDIQAALIKAWPSIMGKPNLKFWEHEWGKHGSCTTDLLPTSNDYLLKGVYLWEQIKFHDLMGVGPGAQFMPNTQYDANTVMAAITSKYKVKTMLTCQGGEILDVRFCYLGPWVLVDCLDTQPPPGTVCTGLIYYPRI
ncbi:putative ribonuclease T(2) [Rosa chinensis]|uniref:Putative ribonuclease T(2) n=1 Tax=Rosa chinensis TaxID=74649 RepID=A0A2P6RD02_ROSCH|nr:putative ribonuclease T(2) [Rosa chinensis]